MDLVRYLNIIVQHFDSATTDQSAFLAFLTDLRIDDAPVVLADGTRTELAGYLATHRVVRQQGITLVRNGHVPWPSLIAALALARARAAVDDFPSSARDIDTACDDLEHVLSYMLSRAGVAVSSVHDVAETGGGGGVHALFRKSRRRRYASITKLEGFSAACVASISCLGFRKRICLLALNILSKAADHGFHPGIVGSDALHFSTRLLVLASSLPPDPAQSSLFPLLARAAGHVGSMATQIRDIDLELWVGAACSVLDQTCCLDNSTFGYWHITVHMLGGMMPSVLPHLESQHDESAACRAKTLLATLVHILDFASDGLPSPSSSSLCRIGLGQIPKVELSHDADHGYCTATASYMGEWITDEFNEPWSLRVGSALSAIDACDCYVRSTQLSANVLDAVLKVMVVSANLCVDIASYAPEAGVERSRDGTQHSRSVNDPVTPSSDSHFTIPDVFELKSPTVCSNSAVSQSHALGDVPCELEKPCRRASSALDLHRGVTALAFTAVTAVLKLTLTFSKSDLELRGYDRKTLAAAVRDGCAVASKFACDQGLLLPGELYRTMTDFGIVAGMWLGSDERSNDEWSRLAADLSSFACPVRVAGSIFEYAPAFVRSGVVLRALANNLACEGLATAFDEVPRQDYPCLDLNAAALYTGSLISKDEAPVLLKTFMELVESQCMVGNVGAIPLQSSCVLISLTHYLLRRGSDISESALDKLRMTLELLDDYQRETFEVLESGTEEKFSTREGSLNDAGSNLNGACSVIVRVVPAHIDSILKGLWLQRVGDLSSKSQHSDCDSSFPSNPCRRYGSGNRFRSGLHAAYLIGNTYSLIRHAQLEAATQITEHDSSKVAKDASIAAYWPTLSCLTIFEMKSIDFGLFQSIALLQAPIPRQAVGEWRNRMFLMMQTVLTTTSTCNVADVFCLDWIIRKYLRSLEKGIFDSGPTVEEISGIFRGIVRFVEEIPHVGDCYCCRNGMSSQNAGNGEDDFSRELTQRSIYYCQAASESSHFKVKNLLLDTVANLIHSLADVQSLTHSNTVREAGYSLAAVFRINCGIRDALRKWIQQAAFASIPALSYFEKTSSSLLIVRGCQISRIIENATKSRPDMDSFISMLDAPFDAEGLYSFGILLGSVSGSANDGYSDAFRLWLSRILPSLSLDRIVEHLMIPVDEAAVSVCATSNALARLDNLCKKHEALSIGVLDSLDRLSGISGTASFLSQVCQRSVIGSVIMSRIVTKFIVSQTFSKRIVSHSKFAVSLFAGALEIFHDVRSRLHTLDIEELRRVVIFLATLLGVAERFATLPNRCRSAVREEHPFTSFVNELVNILVEVIGADALLSKCGGMYDKVILIVGTLNAVKSRIEEPAVKSADSSTNLLGEQKGTEAEDLDIVEVHADMTLSMKRATQQSTKTCSYASTGSQFVEQHWYFCYSCGLSGLEGVCSVCAEVCHAGHDLSYSKYSRFFCDCGATSGRPVSGRPTSTSVSESEALGPDVDPPEDSSRYTVAEVSHATLDSVAGGESGLQGNRVCLCLKPRTPSLSLSSQDAIHDYEGPSCHDKFVWERVASIIRSPDASSRQSHRRLTEFEEPDLDRGWPTLVVEDSSIHALQQVFRSERLAVCLINVARALLDCRIVQHEHIKGCDMSSRPLDKSVVQVVLEIDDDRLFTSRQVYKTSRQSGGGQTLSSQAACIPRNPLALSGSAVTFVNRASLLVFIEPGDKISVMSVRYLAPGPEISAGAPDISDSASISLLARFEPPFTVHAVRSNLERPEFILICGDEAVLVFVLDVIAGRIISKISLSLGLNDVQEKYLAGRPSETDLEPNGLLRADWVPGSAHLVLVVTRHFVKIFDLYEDPVCPAYFAQLPEPSRNLQPLAAGQEMAEPSKSVDIVDAALWLDDGAGWSVSGLEDPLCHYLFVISSDGLVLRACLAENKEGPCILQAFLDLSALFGEIGTVHPCALSISIAPELLWVVGTDGSIYLAEFSGRSRKSPAGLFCNSLGRFEGALPSDLGCYLSQLPGCPNCMLVSSRRCSGSGTGILHFNRKGLLKFQSVGTESSHKVEGTSILVQPINDAFPSAPSVAVMMEDGGILLLQLDNVTQRTALIRSTSRYIDHRAVSDIAREVGAEILIQRSSQSDFIFAKAQRYHSVPPSTVGFFESCVELSEEITLAWGGSLGDKGEKKCRVPLEVASRETFVSPNAAKPLRLAIQCKDKSGVIVGLRLQVGGTDRSKLHAPGQIRVFGRTVNWSFRGTQSKRWIDIPLSLSETASSPHEVLLELDPRNLANESAQGGNGTVAFDILEVYGVSSTEFAERCALFESEAAHNTARLKRNVERRRQTRLSEIVMSAETETALGPCFDIDFYSEYDVRNASTLACIKIALQCPNIPIQSALALRTGIDMSGLVVGTMAERRYAPACENSQFSRTKPLDELLCQLGDVCVWQSLVAERSCEKGFYAFLFERARHAASVMEDEFTTPFMAGHPCPSHLLERIIFLAGRISRFVLLGSTKKSLESSNATSIEQTEEYIPPPFIAEERTLEALCTAYAECRRSDHLLALSCRDMCSNLVDVLLCASWSSLVRSSPSSAPPLFEDISICSAAIKKLVALMTGLNEDIRLFACRRIVDMLEPSCMCPMDFNSHSDWIHLSLMGPAAKNENSVSVTDSGRGAGNNENVCSWTYKCDVCQAECEPTWWHCADCDDFDLCCHCVNFRGTSLPAPHSDKHLLLRGIPDTQESLPIHAMPPCSRADLVCRLIFRGIISDLMSVVFGNVDSSSSGLQLLESIETIYRLISAPSRLDLRAARLDDLFHPDSGLIKGIESALLSSEVKDWGTHGFRTIQLSGAVTLENRTRLFRMETTYLLIRLLAAVKDVAYVPRVLNCGVLRIIGRFLDELAPVLVADVAYSVGKPIGKDLFSDIGKLSDAGLRLLPSVASSSQIPASLLDGELSSASPHRTSSIFGRSNVGVTTSPGLEIAGSILDVFIHVLGSVAGHHLEMHVDCISKFSLCALSHLCESTTDKTTSTPVELDMGRPNDEYSLLSSIAERARQALFLVCRGDAAEVDLNLDHYFFKISMDSLFRAYARVDTFAGDVAYDIQLEVTRVLTAMLKVTRLRPGNWMEFVAKQDFSIYTVEQGPRGLTSPNSESTSTIVGILWEVAVNMVSEARVKSLQLLALSIEDVASEIFESSQVSTKSKERKSRLMKGSVEVSDRSADAYSHPDIHACTTIQFLMSSAMARLRHLVGLTLLRSSDTPVRKAVAVMLKSMIVAGARAGEMVVLNSVGDLLVELVPSLSFAGHRGGELAEALTLLVNATKDTRNRDGECEWLSRLGSVLGTLLRNAASQLSMHPNTYIYRRLSTLMPIDSYYLESDPCLACCCSEAAGDNRRTTELLDVLRAEAKFTDCAIFCRLIAAQSISSVSVKIAEPDSARMAKRINFYHSVRSVADAAELKARDYPWRLSASLDLDQGQLEAQVELEIPVEAANVMFEFAEFYTVQKRLRNRAQSDATDTDANGSSILYAIDASGIENDAIGGLQCPRCSRNVTNRYGICRSCGENSFQCRVCRNIMYEVLDGFLCNECGYSKHGRFEFSLVCNASFAAEPILVESDRKRATAVAEFNIGLIHKHQKELETLRTELVGVLATASSDLPLAMDAGTLLLPEQREKGVMTQAEVLGSVDQANMDVVLRALGGEEVHMRPGWSQSTTVSAVVPGVLGDSHDGNLIRSRPRTSSPRAGMKAFDSASSAFNVPGYESPKLLSIRMSGQASLAASLYSSDCRNAFIKMSRGIRILTSTREELLRYTSARYGGSLSEELTASSSVANLLLEHANNGFGTTCFGCTQACLSHCIPLLEVVLGLDAATRLTLGSADFVLMLLRCCNLFVSSRAQTSVRRIICMLVTNSVAVMTAVCTEISRKLEFCTSAFQSVDAGAAASVELMLLQDICRIEDACWEDRLRMVFRILLNAANACVNSAPIAELIILPCLRAASSLLSNPANGHGLAASVPSCGSRSPASVDGGETGMTCAKDYLSFDRGPAYSLENVPERSIRSIVERESDNVADADVVADGTGLSAPASAPVSGSSEQQRESNPRRFVDHGWKDDEIIYLNSSLGESHERGHVVVNFEDWSAGRDSFSKWSDRSKLSIVHMCKALPTVPLMKNEAASKSVLKILFCIWRQCTRESASGASRSSLGFCDQPNMQTVNGDMSWALQLLLYSPCASVRIETSLLLDELCRGEELLCLRLLDSLLGSPLDNSTTVGSMATEFFDVFQRLISAAEVRLYLVAKGFLPRLVALIEAEAERMHAAEQHCALSAPSLDVSQGYALQRLIDLLRSVLTAVAGSTIKVRRRIIASKSSDIVTPILRAFLLVEGLVTLRTKITDQCGSSLSGILSSQSYLFLAPAGEVVVAACIQELVVRLSSHDLRAISTILVLLCSVLCPVKEEPIYQLILEKAVTQQEFIRGNMTRAFYPTSEFDGPLMRDVKVKICQDLGLTSLLEDDCGDFGLELIVAGNLVKLDLPISAVYEHVWRGSAFARELAAGGLQRGRNIGLRRAVAAAIAASTAARAPPSQTAETPFCPPMLVIYRLSGLDGEATEPIVDRLPDSAESTIDPEVEFKDTKAFGESSGLSVLLRLLTEVGSRGHDMAVTVRELTVRLLRACCEIAENRAKLAFTRGAVDVLLDCVASALERSQESTAAVESAESLLIATEKILSEHSGEESDTVLLGCGAAFGPTLTDDLIGRLRAFLGHLSVVSSPKAEASLLHLLPYLMQGEANALRVVTSHFKVDWEDIDDDIHSQRLAGQLAAFLGAAPLDFRGDRLYNLVIEQSLASSIAAYLRCHFPSPKLEHADCWKLSLEAAGAPHCLDVLRGLANGLKSPGAGPAVASHLRRVLIDGGLIPSLCQLEMSVSASSIGSAAEELLGELQLDGLLRDAIADERRIIKETRRAAADASKRAALANTVRLLPGESDISAVNLSALQTSEMFADVADEIGPACVVCGDGFTSRPDEALGVYVLSRRIPVERTAEASHIDETMQENNASSRSWSTRSGVSFFVGPPSSEGSGCSTRVRGPSSAAKFFFSNVTHFNAIHLACHREAARSDRSIRPLRDEWDGASLRNSQTKCNNIFPIKPPGCFALNDAGSTGQEDNQKQAESSFALAVEFYTRRLALLGRSSMSQLQLIVHDLAQSICRYGFGRPSVFSEISLGGGPHSNASLIPHLLQLAWHVLDTSKESKPQAFALFKDDVASCLVDPEGHLNFSHCLAKCLIGLSLSEWENYMPKLLANILDNVKNSASNQTDVFARVLREFAFADRICRYLKDGTCGSGDGWRSEVMSRIAHDQDWLVDFAARLTESWEKQICDMKGGEQLVDCLLDGIAHIEQSDKFIRGVRACFESH